MAECDAERVDSIETNGCGACHGKHVFRGIVDTRVNTAHQRLAGVVVLEFEITGRERHSTDVESRVDGQVQRFQVAIRDYQTGISIASKYDAEGVIHTTDGHRSRAGHIEQIFRGIVRAGVNTIGQFLAGVIVLEFEIDGRERHPTYVECRVDRQIQGFQVAIGDHQTRISIATKYCAEGVVDTLDRDRSSPRHIELIFGGIVGAGVSPVTQFLTGVVVGKFEITGRKRHTSDIQVRVDGEIQNLQVTIRDHQAGISVVTKYGAQSVIDPLDRDRCSTRHPEQRFRGIVDAGVNTVNERLTRIGILEFEITGRECHPGNIEVRIDGQVQSCQVAICDCHAGISIVAKHDAEGIIHSLDGHRGRTRHIELIFRGVVDARVNTVHQHLTRIGVLELEITGRERYPTDIEVGVDGQVQNFQVTIRDHQTGISIVAEHHAEGIIHTLDGHRGTTRHVELVFRGIVGPRVNTVHQCLARVIVLEFKIARRERHATDIQIRVDRQVQELQIAICNHQAGISIMAEHHVKIIVDTLDGDRRSPRHVKLIFRRIVDTRVNTVQQRLTRVRVLEFEI